MDSMSPVTKIAIKILTVVFFSIAILAWTGILDGFQEWVGSHISINFEIEQVDGV